MILVVGDMPGGLLLQTALASLLGVANVVIEEWALAWCPEIGGLAVLAIGVVAPTLKRIALVTHLFPPGHIGGTEVLTLQLAQELQAAGHAVQVICAEDWETAPSYQITPTDDEFKGIPVRRLRFNWMKAPDVFGYLYNNPEVERHFHQFLDQVRPDIVHITSCASLSASVIGAAHRRQIPILLSATDFWFLCARNTLLQGDGSLCSGPESAWKCNRCMLWNAKVYRWPRKILPDQVVAALLQPLGRFPRLTRLPGLRGMHGDWSDRLSFLSDSLRTIDRIVTASQFLKALFIQYGVAAERIAFLPYGLDTSWARGLEHRALPARQLRVGFIGQIIPIKGPDLLLKALERLNPEAPVEVKVYGDLTKMPAYGQHLRELAAGDSRVSFLDTFDSGQIGSVLAGLDVLVVPSTWYDFPLVIPAALAAQVPAVASNLPGMNEMVEHEVNGLLFERGDHLKLAQVIQRLVDQPDLLTKLRAGIRPVKTVAQMATEYMSMYAALA